MDIFKDMFSVNGDAVEDCNYCFLPTKEKTPVAPLPPQAILLPKVLEVHVEIFNDVIIIYSPYLVKLNDGGLQFSTTRLFTNLSIEGEAGVIDKAKNRIRYSYPITIVGDKLKDNIQFVIRKDYVRLCLYIKDEFVAVKDYKLEVGKNHFRLH